MNFPLEIADLQFGYTQPLIQKPFTAQLPFNGLTGIIGKNGIGKTTLVKTLGHILPPLDGKITINGRNLAKTSWEERAQLVSYCFSHLPQPDLKVEEILYKPGYNTAITGFLLHKFGIENLIDRHFNQLSDGQKQMIMIIRAFAQSRFMVILDEPENHLDFDHIHLLYDALKELSAKYLIVFTTHNLANAIKFSDFVWILTRGEIFVKTPEDLILNNLLKKVFNLPDSFWSSLFCSFYPDVEKKHDWQQLAVKLFKERLNNNGLQIRIDPQNNILLDTGGQTLTFDSFYSLRLFLINV